MDNIRNIVFDLGGVIITLDPGEAVRRFLEIGMDNALEILDPYHQKGIFLDLEEGRLSREEFYDALRKETGKNISDKDIDYGWFGFLKETPGYKLEMLEQLKEKYNLYLLSNTNPIIMSWAHTGEFSGKGKSLDDYFDKLYLSYEMGVTKPHKDIFYRMISDSGINPSETLFVDDGSANIEAGKSLGMRTYQPENGEDFRRIFK
ncbi:MAG: HAD family phosphatase [Dysgonamonadaceae bacterium]|jgi:putative hydrolase of the HAD superfamily|nr:HAD family phosphatase [Dysgonamonadaceae bacterium]